MLLFLAEIIPEVTVPPKPKGFPIAITQSPTRALLELPKLKGINFSLDFELTYNVLSPDYETLTEINHEIRLKIFETFEKEKLEFAYPTRTIHISKDS